MKGRWLVLGILTFNPRILEVPSKEIEDYTLEDFGGVRSEKTVCIVRYGAFGDMLIISSILPLLKSEGYRICINASERGRDIIKSDPHVDEIIFQKTDAVPNNRLTEYWEKMAKCFDRFIQLSESIEKSLLLMPQRWGKIKGHNVILGASEHYDKSKEFIHNLCDKNYLEITHDIAGVPYEFNSKFYPYKSEKKWASKQRQKIKSKNIVLWSLSGSSVHKVYPWTDIVMEEILKERDDVSFVTVGDDLCQLLERGWEKEKKIITKSGKWSIRKTLTFLDKCQVIVGPETGVMNAASMMDVHKCVMLSHSSQENISKHWKNTIAFEPSVEDCPCFPCHKMHFGFNTCNRDEETGGAMCAVKTRPEPLIEDILRNLI